MRPEKPVDPLQQQLAEEDGARPPEQVWDEYFRNNQPDAVQLADAILVLHKQGRHDHVIAAINAAIIHGNSQPWMFDALALAMKIEGRPSEDIERVLFSRIDFSGTDVASMLYSAAYLTRFGAHEPALRLYRQASKLQPTRPEPYVLGLKLAREQQDPVAIAWAAAGILTYAWSADHEKLHRQAEIVVEEAEQRLNKNGQAQQAETLRAAFDDAKKRDLVLELTWSGTGDLDLIVEEPAGTVCSAQDRYSRGGGVLAHDGYGPDQANCYERYVCAIGVPGMYRVRVRHAGGDIVGRRAQLTLTRYFGTERESTERLFLPLSASDRIVRLLLPQGRRTELAPANKLKPAETPEATSRLRSGQFRQRPSPAGLAAVRRFQESRSRLGTSNRRVGVGLQSVVLPLSEGVSMSALAVVSADRRYVKVSVAPSFSSITDVFTFSFLTTGNAGAAAPQP